MVRHPVHRDRGAGAPGGPLRRRRHLPLPDEQHRRQSPRGRRASQGRHRLQDRAAHFLPGIGGSE